MRIFKFSTKKNQAGEVSIASIKKSFRTLNVTGRVKVPYSVNSLKSLFSIIKQEGASFLGQFPFLDKKRNSYICTYSLPERFAVKPTHIYLTYDYTFSISESADNISTKTILQSVLKKNEVIGDHLLRDITKELIACNLLDPSQASVP